MLGILDISATGLGVQRNRLTQIANNIANAETTRAGVDRAGKPLPYRRRTLYQKPQQDLFGRTLQGVKGQYIIDPRPFKEVHMPEHPDADPETGMLKMPNVNVLNEYVDAMMAQRGYEANVQVMNVTKSMLNSSIRILA